MKTLAIAVNNSAFFWSHRLYMAEQAKDRGFRVVVLSPAISNDELERYRRAGFLYREIEIARHGLNPFADMKTLKSFKKALSDMHVDVFHAFTVKCNIYGCAAAAELGVPVILATVTGLGIPFVATTRKARFIQWMIRKLYRRYLPENATVIFQNTEDMKYFKDHGYLTNQRTVLIPGNGVNLEMFSPPEARHTHFIPRILFPARLVMEKGIRETMDACEQLANEGEKFELWVCGDAEENMENSIPDELRAKWQSFEWVKWLGFQANIQKTYKEVDMVCLPSYREGLCQSLVETAASGLPAVTTDVAGCRDVVVDGETGVLLPAQSAQDLVQPLRDLIRSPELREQLGHRAREVALERFDRQKIVALYLNLYRSTLESAKRLGNSRLFNKRVS